LPLSTSLKTQYHSSGVSPKPVSPRPFTTKGGCNDFSSFPVRSRGFVCDKSSGVLRDAIRCPECGSSRIEYPQFSRRFTWGAIAAVFADLGFFEKKFFCKHCQYTWPTKVKVEPKRDLLGWPEER
jgi:hypothetical protein